MPRYTISLVALAALFLFTVSLAGSQAPGEDYTKVDPAELGVKPVPPKKDPGTGFVVGGRNPTPLIRKLTEIAGRKIADLEKDMRPGAMSRAGFLGKEERLLEVMAADNAFVVDQHKRTHQELALHLRVVGAIALKQARGGPKEFTYHGRKFKVKSVSFRGYQDSPFKDGTRTSSDVTVWNLSNGKRLTYSLLVPLMVERYGFYEGRGTTYRVDPRAVLQVFDFLKKAEAR